MHTSTQTHRETHIHTRTHTHTLKFIHLHTPWSAASGRSRESIRYTHTLYAGFGLFVCMLVYVCVCVPFFMRFMAIQKRLLQAQQQQLPPPRPPPGQSEAQHNNNNKQQQQEQHEAVKLKSEQTLPKLLKGELSKASNVLVLVFVFVSSCTVGQKLKIL